MKKVIIIMSLMIASTSMASSISSIDTAIIDAKEAVARNFLFTAQTRLEGDTTAALLKEYCGLISVNGEITHGCMYKILVTQKYTSTRIGRDFVHINKTGISSALVTIYEPSGNSLPSVKIVSPDQLEKVLLAAEGN